MEKETGVVAVCNILAACNSRSPHLSVMICRQQILLVLTQCMKGWFGLLTSNLICYNIVKSLNLCFWNISELTQDTYAKVQPCFIIPHQCCRIETVLFPSAKTWAGLCMIWGVTQRIWKTLNWNIEMEFSKIWAAEQDHSFGLGCLCVLCKSQFW